MKITVAAITFAITMGGLFLFENYKTLPREENYAKIVSNLRQTHTPSPTIQSSKTPIKTSAPVKQKVIAPVSTPSFAQTSSPTPKIHIYYTSSSTSAKYYYCDTDSGWKSLSKANLKQFSSPEELLKSYPTRTLREACK